MKISTKGRYGLRAMFEIAKVYEQGPVLMSTISKNQGISRKYLHSLLTSLKSAGLVRSVLGSRGGFLLSKPPSQITVKEIVTVLEGSLSPVDCVDFVEDERICERMGICPTLSVWVVLKKVINDLLSCITLEDILNGNVNEMKVEMTFLNSRGEC